MAPNDRAKRETDAGYEPARTTPMDCEAESLARFAVMPSQTMMRTPNAMMPDLTLISTP